ncbi:1765_t:CDS:1, partial [Scutellospora calospora]
ANLEIVFGIKSLDFKLALDPNSDTSLGHIKNLDLGTGLSKEELTS